VVSGKVGGVSANILIDTGAEINLIGAPLIEKLQVSSANCKVDRVVVTGARSAHELKTLGAVDQVVIFAAMKSEFKRKIEFVATPDYSGDAVIGLPTMKCWGLTIRADMMGSIVTIRDWPGEQLKEVLLSSHGHRVVADSKRFCNLKVEKKPVWGLELVNMVPPERVTSICQCFSKVAKREFKTVESLGKDIVPTLNRLVLMGPTVVYMRFARKSQLYQLLDLLVACPQVFQAQDKVVGIAALVASPSKATLWRKLLRKEGALSSATLFLSKQIFPQTTETKAAVAYVVEHLKSLELSDSLEERWRGDGKGNDSDDEDEDRMFPPTDVKEKPLPNRAQIIEMVKSENAKLKLEVARLLEQRINLLGDPRTAKVVGYEHHIRLIPKTTTISAYREVAEAHREVVREEVKRLMEAKTIIPAPDAFSPFVSPVVVVPKKDEHGLLTKRRMCVDYRALNKRTIRDQYALPNLESCLHLRKGVIFSKVDLASAYHQIPVALQDQVKTGFIVDRQVYLWRYMPFGLSNAPATMQRLIDKVLGSAKDNFAQGYLDDIIVYSENEDMHVKHLAEIFGRLDRYGLRIGLTKCEFGMSKILFLGHLISHGEIIIDPSKVEDAKKLARPTSVKELQSFLGVTGWCRKFIYNYAGISAPLTNLLRKECNWVWGEAQERAWKSLKDAIVKAPVLIQPNFEKLFVLETDASDEGIGGVLLQRSEIDEKSAMKPIAYVSRKLTSAERQYSTREKECLAIVWATERLKMYLWGRVFAVFTDHRSLQWIQQVMYDNSRIGRWARKLSAFEFDIKFRAGSQNQLADGLSRAPIEGQRPKSVLVLMKLVLVNTRAQVKRTPAQQAAAEAMRQAVERKKAERKGEKAPVVPSPTIPQDKAVESQDAKSSVTQHGMALPKEPPSKSGPSVRVEPSSERKMQLSIPPSAPKDRVEREVPALDGRRIQGNGVMRSEIPSAGVVADAMPPVAETIPTGVSKALEPVGPSSSPEVRSSIPQVSADDDRGESTVRVSGVPEYRLSRAPTSSGSELNGRSVRRRVHEPSGDRAEDPLGEEVRGTPQSPALAPSREEMLSEVDDHSSDHKRGMISERDEKKVEVLDDLDELDSARLDLSSLLDAESKRLVESKTLSSDKKFEIPDKEVWRRLLLEDPTYGQIIRYIIGKDVPKSRADRDRLNTIKAKYVYEQGLLYFRRALDDGSEKLLAEVPEVCRRNLVQSYHDMAMAGHRGAEAMVKQIRLHYNWPSLRRDVREYAQQCLKCWLAKTPAPSRAGLLVQWGTRVEKFAVVHVDFVGPLPFIGKKDEKYVLTMKDRGTGMIEAVPVENRTAEVAASAIWRYWFCRFGVPKVVVSDRDRTFGGSLFRCLSEQLGYDISRTTAYHPQANGMLERDHRTFKAFLNTCCLGTDDVA